MKYLQTFVNYLTADEARKREADGWIVWQNQDGHWSAVRLVDAPVQHGQAPWAGRAA
jgi:hypothetical protein